MLVEKLRSGNKIENMLRMIRQLRSDYKPRFKKAKKCVNFKDKIQTLIEKNIPWQDFAMAIRKISNEEYNNFLLNIEQLKLKRNMKEYFLKIRFYSEITKSAAVMNNLEENVPSEDMVNLITDKIEIDNKVLHKYTKMCDDKGKKEIYPTVGGTMIVHPSEVMSALDNINYEKATSWDYIPGLAYKEIYKLKDKKPEEYESVCIGIGELLTELLGR
jgi:hypothetical protein